LTFFFFFLLFRFSWVIGTKTNTQALLMPRNTAADYRPSDDWRGDIWMFAIWHPRYVGCAPVRIFQG
jgi:hypothetical protein